MDYSDNVADAASDMELVESCETVRSGVADELRGCPRPAVERPSAKRRRRNPTLLHTLPVEALAKVFRFLHSEGAGDECTTLSDLHELLPLRMVSVAFRDAFDGHVMSLSLSWLHLNNLQKALGSIVSKFRNLSTLSLPGSALCEEMHTCWAVFFQNTNIRLQHLIFSSKRNGSEDSMFPPNMATASLVASSCRSSLEVLSTDCNELVLAVAEHCPNVHVVNLLMDRVIEKSLLGFRSIRTLSVVYRKGLDAGRARGFTETVQAMQHGRMLVHVRANQLRSSQFEMFPHVPGLRKISIFDGAIEDRTRGMRMLANCQHLEEIQFEWVRNLTGKDVADLAKEMRGRLMRLRIWECEDVNDEGLVALAEWCPHVEVDLRFIRDQFSQRALSLLGDRVSWGSHAF